MFYLKLGTTRCEPFFSPAYIGSLGYKYLIGDMTSKKETTKDSGRTVKTIWSTYFCSFHSEFFNLLTGGNELTYKTTA